MMERKRKERRVKRARKVKRSKLITLIMLDLFNQIKTLLSSFSVLFHLSIVFNYDHLVFNVFEI